MRVLQEHRHVLRSNTFTVVTSNRGGTIVSVDPRFWPRITRPVQGELQHGRAAALMVCPRIFARVQNRRIRLGDNEHELVYPADVNPAEVDPDGVFLHDLAYLFTWEEQPGASEEEITYRLDAARLPPEDPLPYSATVTYRLEGNSLIIEAAVLDTARPTPAALAVHPYLRFHLGTKNDSLQLSARLSKRFEYPADGRYPMNDGSRTEYADGGPFTKSTRLPPVLDHSYLAESGSAEIRWQDGPRLSLVDETPGIQAHYLHLWTTSGISANVCGVEHGGLGNACELAARGIIPEAHLNIVHPGERKVRIVRYTLLD